MRDPLSVTPGLVQEGEAKSKPSLYTAPSHIRILSLARTKSTPLPPFRPPAPRRPSSDVPTSPGFDHGAAHP